MAKASTPVLTITMTASGAITGQRYIQQSGATTGADGNAIGVARTSAADTTKVSVDVLGTAIVETGAAVTALATQKSDSTGRTINWATSGGKLAIALESSAGAGEFIEVLLLNNVA